MTSGYYLDRGYHSHMKIWGSDGWLELDPFQDVPLKWYSRKEKSPEIQDYSGPKEPKGYTPFVREAVRAAAGLQEPPISNADSLRVLKTIFAFYEAAETGQTQSV
jgi:predicted dehydrogenase